MTPNDGGPAFARPAGTTQPSGDAHHNYAQSGMSLRDYFAGQALVGELASQSSISPTNFGQWHSGISLRCYEIADAMLKARQTTSA